MQWTELTPLSEANLNDLEARINQASTNVDNGKATIAQAIGTMGQTASSSDSFTTLSNKIKDISKDANATTGDVITGKTYYEGGVKRTGTMPNRGAATIIPSATSPVSIPAGYHNGSGTVSQVSVPTANVLTGTNIAGAIGTMPNRSSENVHMPALEVTTWAGDRTFFRPPNGYYNGSTWVTAPATDLIAANIRKGKTIHGVTGDSLEYGYGSQLYSNQIALLSPWLAYTINIAGPVNSMLASAHNGVLFTRDGNTVKRVNWGGGVAWTTNITSPLIVQVFPDGTKVAVTTATSLIILDANNGGVIANTAYPNGRAGTGGAKIQFGSNGDIYVPVTWDAYSSGYYIVRFNSAGAYMSQMSMCNSMRAWCLSSDEAYIYAFGADNSYLYRAQNVTSGDVSANYWGSGYPYNVKQAVITGAGMVIAYETTLTESGTGYTATKFVLVTGYASGANFAIAASTYAMHLGLGSLYSFGVYLASKGLLYAMTNIGMIILNVNTLRVQGYFVASVANSGSLAVDQLTGDYYTNSYTGGNPYRIDAFAIRNQII